MYIVYRVVRKKWNIQGVHRSSSRTVLETISLNDCREIRPVEHFLISCISTAVFIIWYVCYVHRVPKKVVHQAHIDN